MIFIDTQISSFSQPVIDDVVLCPHFYWVKHQHFKGRVNQKYLPSLFEEYTDTKNLKFHHFQTDFGDYIVAYNKKEVMQFLKSKNITPKSLHFLILEFLKNNL